MLYQVGKLSEADMEACQRGLAMRWGTLHGGFHICVPPSCHPPDAMHAVSLLILSFGHGLLSGPLLKHAALGLPKVFAADSEAQEYIQKCVSFADAQDVVVQTVELNSGFSMPMLAFGTAGMDRTRETVQEALRVGFRAVDTATNPSGGNGFGYDQEKVFKATSVKISQKTL